MSEEKYAQAFEITIKGTMPEADITEKTQVLGSLMALLEEVIASDEELNKVKDIIKFYDIQGVIKGDTIVTFTEKKDEEA